MSPAHVLPVLPASIHCPGTIQPHGALVAFDRATRTVAACSANTALYLGHGPAELLGNGIESLGIDSLAALVDGLAAAPSADGLHGRSATLVPADGAPLAAMLHADGGPTILLEVERPSERPSERADTALQADLHNIMAAGLATIRDAATVEELGVRTAATIRRLTGMERVAVYRFDAQGVGHAVAEDRAADWEDPLPAFPFETAPLPEPVRTLCTRSRLRLLPDREAEAVPLLPAVAGAPPIDLTLAILRTPAPDHLDHLRAIGVSAALSVSIVKAGRLWGVIVGHHRLPHAVPPAARAMAGMLADAFSLGLDAAERTAMGEVSALATMSHELRTPLNAIIGFSSLLLSDIGGPLTDRQRDHVASIAASGAHLLGMVNDILDLAKIEAGRFELADEELDLAEAIGEVHALEEHALIGAGLRFDTVLPSPAPQLRADRRALRQMLLNLVSNAVKYTPKGGRITVEAKRGRTGGLTIAVADTGVGIALEHLGLVLEPFRQVPSEQNRAGTGTGTGLGLPIVKSLMDAHGGRLTVDSVVGQGTRVTLHFPAARLVERGAV